MDIYKTKKKNKKDIFFGILYIEELNMRRHFELAKMKKCGGNSMKMFKSLVFVLTMFCAASFAQYPKYLNVGSLQFENAYGNRISVDTIEGHSPITFLSPIIFSEGEGDSTQNVMTSHWSFNTIHFSEDYDTVSESAENIGKWRTYEYDNNLFVGIVNGWELPKKFVNFYTDIDTIPSDLMLYINNNPTEVIDNIGGKKYTIPYFLDTLLLKIYGIIPPESICYECDNYDTTIYSIDYDCDKYHLVLSSIDNIYHPSYYPNSFIIKTIPISFVDDDTFPAYDYRVELSKDDAITCGVATGDIGGTTPDSYSTGDIIRFILPGASDSFTVIVINDPKGKRFYPICRYTFVNADTFCFYNDSVSGQWQPLKILGESRLDSAIVFVEIGSRKWHVLLGGGSAHTMDCFSLDTLRNVYIAEHITSFWDFSIRDFLYISNTYAENWGVNITDYCLQTPTRTPSKNKAMEQKVKIVK